MSPQLRARGKERRRATTARITQPLASFTDSASSSSLGRSGRKVRDAARWTGEETRLSQQSRSDIAGFRLSSLFLRRLFAAVTTSNPGRALRSTTLSRRRKQPRGAGSSAGCGGGGTEGGTADANQMPTAAATSKEASVRPCHQPRVPRLYLNALSSGDTRR